MSEKNVIMIVSGPSGVGKGSVVARMIELCGERGLSIDLSVSTTSRDMRAGEIADESYHFVSRDQFEQLIADGDMVEYNCYGGNYYGTNRQNILESFANGRDVLLEIDVNGADQIVRQFEDSAVTVFILPPTMEELESRLRKRGRDSESDILARLAESRAELKRADNARYRVVNDEIEKTAERLIEIYLKEKNPAAAEIHTAPRNISAVRSGAADTKKKNGGTPEMKSIDEVFEMAESRYALVGIVSKRARELAEEAGKRGEPLLEKPVNIVLNNLKTGRSTIVKPGATSTLYSDDDFELGVSVEQDSDGDL